MPNESTIKVDLPVQTWNSTVDTVVGVPKVYAAIVAVIADLGREGISKDRKNAQQNYSFRGIDDVYAAVSPCLARHRLCLLPRVMARSVTEQQSKAGGILFYVVLDVEFDLVSAEDGSSHTIKACGEAMDSGDKATNKAMSAAYKYACMQTFCIPTEGDNDADATTHTVVRPLKVDPRPEGTDSIDPDTIYKYTKAFRDALQDRNEEKILKIHDDLNADPETYSAVHTALEPKEKVSIKDAIISARQERAKVRKAF